MRFVLQDNIKLPLWASFFPYSVTILYCVWGLHGDRIISVCFRIHAVLRCKINTKRLWHKGQQDHFFIFLPEVVLKMPLNSAPRMWSGGCRAKWSMWVERGVECKGLVQHVWGWGWVPDSTLWAVFRHHPDCLLVPLGVQHTTFF